MQRNTVQDINFMSLLIDNHLDTQLNAFQSAIQLTKFLTPNKTRIFMINVYVCKLAY